MAHVALIGASGRAGSAILKELSDRGHKVTAIARNPEKIATRPNVTAKKGDALKSWWLWVYCLPGSGFPPISAGCVGGKPGNYLKDSAASIRSVLREGVLD